MAKNIVLTDQFENNSELWWFIIINLEWLIAS